MSDRRVQRRVEFSGQVFEMTPGRPIPCSSVNIGEGGVYIRRKEGGVLLAGEHVWLQVRLPDDPEPLYASGQVVDQVTETFYDAASIEFRGMADTDRQRLRAFLQAA